MKAAIIDVGSNTVRLVIFEKEKNQLRYQKIFDYKKMLQILNYITDDKLSSAGIKALVSALTEYKLMASFFEVDEFYCFATASLRYLTNSDEVISQVYQETQVHIELLSGDDEAKLGFEASFFAHRFEGIGVSLDVGGGSTELVYYNKDKVIHCISLPIGSLSMYLRHVSGLFPKEKERKNIEKSVMKELKSIKWFHDISVKDVVAIGGSARAITRVSKKIFGTKNIGDGESLDISNVHQVAQLDLNKNTKQGESIIQEVKERSSTIIPGAIIISTLAKTVDAQAMVLSRNGIREGYFLRKIREDLL